jgi:signal transduction histidine kinase
VRLTRRLLLALFAAIVVVTVVETLVRVDQLRQALLEDTADDYVTFARSYRALLADAWQERGAGEVRRLVAHANAATAHGCRITLIENSPLPELTQREVVTFEGDHIVVIESLGDGEAAGAAIRVEQRLDTVNQILVRSAQLSAVHAVAVLICAGVLMSVLGWLFVGRPVQRLITITRRIAAGESVSDPVPHQDDELGELAAELLAMAAKLEEARVRTERETALKIEAIEQLRHADRLRSIGELASGLAHEFGTPLHVIYGRARLIEEAEGATDEIRADAAVVREEAAKLTALVRQLLGFARRKAPERQEVDVAAAAARVAQLLAPLAAKSGVAIELSTPDGPCVMRGDPLLIEQAITNVALNGIQAMPKGGHLTIEVARRLVARPGTTRSIPSVVVTIVDDGPGIPPEEQHRIFDPFYTTKDVGEGTGLGLSVVYGIALDHDGFVQVENAPPRGACFKLVFPIDGKHASLVSPPAALPHPAIQNEEASP